MKRKQIKHHPRGVVAVEAALVLPILILITLGFLQYSWLFFKQQQLTNIARHAVRYASRPDVSFADAEAYIDILINKMGIGTDKYFTGEPPVVDWVVGAPDYDPPGDVGNAFYAKVSVDASAVDIINFLPVPAKLTAVATMSKEGSGP